MTCKADLALEKSNLEKNYAIVKEEYRVHSGVTARGSYSIIRRASERKTGIEVAIKSVCRRNIDKTGIRREIVVLQQLDHKFIVNVIKSYHTVQCGGNDAQIFPFRFLEKNILIRIFKTYFLILKIFKDYFFNRIKWN